MDSEEIIGIIIGIICVVGIGWAIIKGVDEKDKREKIKEETYINLLIENERLKAIYELEGDK